MQFFGATHDNVSEAMRKACRDSRNPAGKPIVVVLAGQSNMRGNVAVTSDDQELASDGIKVLNQDLSLSGAAHPLHWGQNYVGPGLSAAESILSEMKPGTEIRLVPCAVGATGFLRGWGTWADGGVQYEDCIARAKVALAGASLGAVLWHQGESDSAKESDALAYYGQLSAMIERVRSDLGHAPFIIGELAPSFHPTRFQHHGIVRDAHADAALLLEDVYLASSDGLTTTDDTHFDRESIDELGARMGLLAAGAINAAP
jgi:hypothetical protein